MKYRLAAFDFDGTLADSLPWFESVLDTVAERYGFRRTSAAEKAQLRHRSAHDILQYLGIPLWKIPAITIHMRRLMQEGRPDIALFADMAATLTRLRQQGLLLSVVSSNTEVNVKRVLGPETSALFTDYECGADLFGKPAKIKRLLQRHRITGAHCILIGDELRDIDAARKTGVHAGSVAWGYNHIDVLRAQQPDELFLRIEDLLNILGKPSAA